jgi:hypothetical protein
MDSRKMMGFSAPGDTKVSVPTRDWSGLKLGLWRSRVAWEIAARAAAEIVGSCKHLEGCPGKDDDSRPCIQEEYEYFPDAPDGTQVAPNRVSDGCPDREARMSALVILNAAQMFAPLDARRPATEQYFAPSREYFSEMISELAIAQTENDALRAALRAAGIEVPAPPAASNPELPTRPVPSPQFELPEHEENVT